jgi:uncharacterized membrane protein
MANQPCLSGERLAVLETKMDAVKSALDEMKDEQKAGNEVQKRIEINLADHMKRTELAEKRIEDVRKQTFMIIGAILVFQTLAAGGVDSLVKVVPFILKLFGL